MGAAKAGHDLHIDHPYRGMPDRARTCNKATVISVDNKAPLPIEKKRKHYAFWGQFHEKPSIIPGCPGPLAILYGQMHRLATACQSRRFCFEDVLEVLVLLGLGLVLDILSSMSMQQ